MAKYTPVCYWIWDAERGPASSRLDSNSKLVLAYIVHILPFHSETSSQDAFFGVRSWSAGTDNQIALYLSRLLCVFTKWNIPFWRWSSLPSWIVWRRLGFGRSPTIQGWCWNLFDPQWTWFNENFTLAALVLASLSVLYWLWSHSGRFKSGGTKAPSSYFGHSYQKPTCCWI